MKRFALVLMALLLMCNSLVCIAETAPEAEASTETDALEFIPGERLDIFEQDGINVYLTGEVVDEGLQFLRMERKKLCNGRRRRHGQCRFQGKVLHMAAL